MPARNEKTLLIVEDEAIIALDLAETARRAGFVVAGPYGDAAGALRDLERAVPDAAVLDVNLGNGNTSEELAERLQEMGVPFLFLSGHTSSKFEMFARFPGVNRIAKPCMPDDLLGALGDLVAERA